MMGSLHSITFIKIVVKVVIPGEIISALYIGCKDDQ